MIQCLRGVKELTRGAKQFAPRLQLFRRRASNCKIQPFAFVGVTF